ncbi:jg12522 [Pararge aegeria aegeria]|uniref:Jg12522 protein n=1 Tax=Pararge aegeria aegeria TaxID=348720 RepID=A0A8S4R2K3_9NEOP|nr:jg12522 [Pararge aegeria aegeria]
MFRRSVGGRATRLELAQAPAPRLLADDSLARVETYFYKGLAVRDACASDLPRRRRKRLRDRTPRFVQLTVNIARRHDLDATHSIALWSCSSISRA